MKVMIDIDKNVFTRLFDNCAEDYAIVNDDLFAIAKAIRKGTPLPKGHGRLIDADALYDSAPLCHTEEDGTACVEWREINDAPTIIEVEESDSE